MRDRAEGQLWDLGGAPRERQCPAPRRPRGWALGAFTDMTTRNPKSGLLYFKAHSTKWKCNLSGEGWVAFSAPPRGQCADRPRHPDMVLGPQAPVRELDKPAALH